MPFYINDHQLMMVAGSGDMGSRLGKATMDGAEYYAIEFCKIAPGEVGREIDASEKQSVLEAVSPLRFMFANPESLNVVIDMLRTLSARWASDKGASDAAQ